MLHEPMSTPAASQPGRLSCIQISFLIVLALLFPRSTFAAVTLSVGPNINISKASGNNVEQAIAINPLNAAQLFASETVARVTRYSTNAGLTWYNSNLSALPPSLGDVATAWD